MQLEGEIVVSKPIECPTAQEQRRNHFLWVQGFFAARDNACLYGIHHPIGDHRGVDAQVIFPCKTCQDRIENRPDAQS
jgi:hypothetical protein